jgi:acyl dehydratase
MIDRDAALALELAPLSIEIERGRLRAFARSIGETDPVYIDPEAAHAAGHRDLLVPPTFFFSMTLESNAPFGYLDSLGVDMRFVLHGEQSFEYFRLAYAGDLLVLQDRITDVQVKRGGALELVVKETDVRRGDVVVATASSVVVVKHPEVAV